MAPDKLDLQSIEARRCLTSGGILVHQGRILLIKHTKLGIWLAPGGHLDPGELPHQTAEREFWEETGVQVHAVKRSELFTSTTSQYLPNPLYSNLHWVCRENYQARLQSNQPEEPHTTELWPRGCEQHLSVMYLVEPAGSLELHPNKQETDDVGWFTAQELEKLETTADIRQELLYAFSLAEHRT